MRVCCSPRARVPAGCSTSGLHCRQQLADDLLPVLSQLYTVMVSMKLEMLGVYDKLGSSWKTNGSRDGCALTRSTVVHVYIMTSGPALDRC